MKNEILPAIRRNPNYLKQNNMEWNGNMVRQKPGPTNSLGKVKFLFPNSYNIYLHDSPAKSLFNEQSRAFSHGCIRLADPKKLADYLLRKNPEWTAEKITAAMNRGKEKYVTLKDPVPVYIGYLTAWVDSQGKINFRKDIYNRDQALEEMLIREVTRVEIRYFLFQSKQFHIQRLQRFHFKCRWNQNRYIVFASAITDHPDGNMGKAFKELSEHVFGFRNFIADNGNDGLIIFHFRGSKRLQFLQICFTGCPLSIVTDTATSEVVTISMGVLYFSNTSNIFRRNP